MTMVKMLMVLALAVGATSVFGEPLGDEALSVDRDLQRQRIDMLRKEKLAELAAQDTACLSRFATTDCQNLVGTRRREMLADLKRRETRLNEMDRRQKGADQLQNARDKVSDKAQRQSEVPFSRESATLEERQNAQNEKVLKHRGQAKSGVPSTPVNKKASGLDPASIESNRTAFAEKQRAAEQRRLDRDKRLIEKPNGSPPLPQTP